MSFLNLSMLAGVAAFAVPLIIHLLNRSRHRQVKWGAMHLLESVLRANQRRFKLQQLLLLLLRCAIPIVLALALARPVITGFRALSGHAPVSEIALLDNSYSMQAGGLRSSFDSAIEETGRVLSTLKQGSDASVLLTGGSVTALADAPSTDVQSLADRLQELKADGGPMKPVEALNAAAATLARAANMRRQLVIVSDFQKSDWGTFAGAGGNRLAQQIKSLPGQPAVTFFRVGHEEKNNVAVESLEFPRMAVGVGQVINVRAGLRNYGNTEQRGLRVYFRIDGNQQAATQIDLGANATTQVEFTSRFSQPGSHVIEVETDTGDLKADNSYAAAVEILERLGVLLVDGDPAGAGLGSETGYLRVALQPFTAAREEITDLIETETVGLREFVEGNLAGKRVVVLANAADLRPDQVSAIDEFVRAGGGLVVLPGDKVRAEFYNADLFAEGAGFLPGKLVETAGSLSDPKRQAAIMGQEFDHPALQFFNDPKNGDLSKSAIRMWHKIEAPGGSNAEGVTVPARLSTGDPFLVQKRYGEGLVLLAATAGDADWSNLPRRPFFVPLMQRLVAHVASNTMPSRNVAVGQPLVAHLPPEARGHKLQITGPDGRKHEATTISRGTQTVAEFSGTDRPGVYTLTDAAGQPLHFVVSTDRRESNLELLADADLEQLAKDAGASVARSAEEYAQLDQSRSFGREIWKGLLACVLGVMFGEQALTRLFSRVRE